MFHHVLFFFDQAEDILSEPCYSQNHCHLHPVSMKPKIVMLKFLQLEIYEKRKSGVRFVVNTEREKKNDITSTILTNHSQQFYLLKAIHLTC